MIQRQPPTLQVRGYLIFISWLVDVGGGYMPTGPSTRREWEKLWGQRDRKYPTRSN